MVPMQKRHLVRGGSPYPPRIDDASAGGAVGRKAHRAPWFRGMPLAALLVLVVALAVGGAGCGPSDADRADRLLETAVTTRGWSRVEATDAVLDLAERLADAGDTRTAARIYQALWDASAAPDRRHVRCAAIRGLARVCGPRAVDDLAAAMAGGDRQVAAAAFAAAARAGGRATTRAWADYLPSAPAAVRPQILRVLGRRGGPAAVEAVLAALQSEDDAVRRAAVEAAADLDTPRVIEPLIALLASEDAADRTAAEAALARLSGPGVSAAVAEYLARGRHVPRGGSPGPPRIGAASAVGAVGQEAHRAAHPVWCTSGAETHRAESLIRVLAARVARHQADAVAACLEDGNADVRTAALKALAILGGERHVPALLDALVGAEEPGVREAAEGALAAVGARVSRGGPPGPPRIGAASAVGAVGQEAHRAAHPVWCTAGTETRREQDVTAAFVSRVVGAMEKAGPDARSALLRALGRVPAPEGLEAVRRAVRDTDGAVREAAVRVLADWPAAAAADDLLAVARGAGPNGIRTEVRKHRVLGLRGYIRRAGRAETPAARVAMYRQAMEAAERPEERRLALAGLATVASPRALALAREWMKRETLRAEAAAAVVAIAERIGRDHPREAGAALEAVLEALEEGKLRDRAERVLQRLRRPGYGAR